MDLKYESDYVPDLLIETIEDSTKNPAIPDNEVCWFDELPDEVIHQIFGYISPSVLGAIIQKVCMRWQQIVSDFSLFATLSPFELDQIHHLLPENVVDQFILTASYEDLLNRKFCSHNNEQRWEQLCRLKTLPDEDLECNNNNNDKNTLSKNARITWKQYFTEYVRKNPPVCEYCRRHWINSLLRAGIRMKMKGKSFHSICWLCKKILDPFHPGHIPSFVGETVEAVRNCPDCSQDWDRLKNSQAIPGNQGEFLGMCPKHGDRLTSDIQRLHPRTTSSHGSLCRHTDEWWSKYWKDPKVNWFPDSIKQEKFEKMMKQQSNQQAIAAEKERKKQEREAKKLEAAKNKQQAKELRNKDKPRRSSKNRKGSQEEIDDLQLDVEEVKLNETENMEMDEMEVASVTSEASENEKISMLRNKRKEPRNKEGTEVRKAVRNKEGRPSRNKKNENTDQPSSAPSSLEEPNNETLLEGENMDTSSVASSNSEKKGRREPRARQPRERKSENQKH